MSTLLSLFANDILPPLLVMAAGFVLERLVGIDPKAISRVALYILTPCLIFSSLMESKVGGGEFGQIALFVVTFTVLLWAVDWAVARLMRFDQKQTNAFMLATLFSNCGNYGLAVILFAFGQQGLERGLAYFVVSAILTHTLAAYFASRGNYSVKQSILNVFRLPLVYAVSLGLVLRLVGVSVPEPIMRAINLPRTAAIPMMQLLLGIQLARISKKLDLRFVGVSAAVGLVGSAALAFGLTHLLGMTGLTRGVSILEASMPTAVSTLALSIEFGSNPEDVGSVVFLTTLLSPITLTFVLALVKGM
jgi:malate permease and related proteins